MAIGALSIDDAIVLRAGSIAALPPRRWVVERSFAWAARFRCLAKDYERLPETVAGLHLLVFACLMIRHVAEAMQ